jgi:hypothetical protein
MELGRGGRNLGWKDPRKTASIPSGPKPLTESFYFQPIKMTKILMALLHPLTARKLR